MLVEEWGWQPLAAALGRLLHLAHLERAEERVRRAPPNVALALFLLPAVALLPVKLFALWLMHAGHRMSGLVAIVLAKLVGTAFVARLYGLVEPQLMAVPWMARAIGRWRAVTAAVHRSLPWRAARVLQRRLRRAGRRLRARLG